MQAVDPAELLAMAEHGEAGPSDELARVAAEASTRLHAALDSLPSTARYCRPDTPYQRRQALRAGDAGARQGSDGDLERDGRYRLADAGSTPFWSPGCATAPSGAGLADKNLTGLPTPPPWEWNEEARYDLASATLVIAVEKFRDTVLATGRWNPDRGASLKT